MTCRIRHHLYHSVAFLCLVSPCLVSAADEGPKRPESSDEQVPILKLTVACRGCHGHEGKTPMFPGIPTIGFQDRDYLVIAMRAFRNGERIINVDNSPLGLEMMKMIPLLTDENIERFADYFAIRPVWDMTQPVEYPASYSYPDAAEK